MSRGGDLVRTAVRGVGQTLVTAGLVVLLFVVYELWVTDLLTAREQDRLGDTLTQEWAEDPTVADPAAAAAVPTVPTPEVGEPFAVLHVPRLGEDWARVVVEGTGTEELAQGPGHYVGTAMPGQPGNVGIAGHRVGRGSPFLDLDRMRPGDAVVVETEDSWFVYRVLGDRASGDPAADPSGIPGQHVVRPSDVAVLSPTPNAAADAPPTGAYLTITTCHPRYSAQQRLIVHAALDGEPISKAVDPDGPPALDES
ncbi:class E sortase [Modestobacter sp. SYSU DS0290]